MGAMKSNHIQGGKTLTTILGGGRVFCFGYHILTSGVLGSEFRLPPNISYYSFSLASRELFHIPLVREHLSRWVAIPDDPIFISDLFGRNSVRNLPVSRGHWPIAPQGNRRARLCGNGCDGMASLEVLGRKKWWWLLWIIVDPSETMISYQTSTNVRPYQHPNGNCSNQTQELEEQHSPKLPRNCGQKKHIKNSTDVDLGRRQWIMVRACDRTPGTLVHFSTAWLRVKVGAEKWGQVEKSCDRWVRCKQSWCCDFLSN